MMSDNITDMKFRPLLFLLIVLSFKVVHAQETTSTDELFKQARTAAFDQKDYLKAIALSKQALHQSPDYADIRIFLGRLYTWSKQPDSARAEFNRVLQKKPDNEDATLAAASLAYWNDNPANALDLLQHGLHYHPASKDLLLLKAKVLAGMKRYNEAETALDSLRATDKGNTEARALASRIRDYTSKNKIGISYDYIYFDKQFDAAWHLASVDYTRQTGIGPVTARLNYANRFSTNGTQAELEAYPHISQTFYAYVSGGYSGNVGVFPKYRAGFSLYANLPAAFEAEAGFRYLTFGDPTWIYTASIGKYYKRYWFNFRTFLTPSNSAISQSFGLNMRYYYGGADDYLSLGLGTGISPDDPRNNVLLNNGNPYKLRSDNVSAGYRHAFKTFNLIFINLSLVNQEYRQHTRGNQFDAGIGYIRRF
ncbi:YaiO family outer membrane beta-barrel protein [Mucilaginibacter sp. L3T2-6]|uniref:YaiO family outer membrane beta-barrel protein n=2 Tax=Mucilaginibacter sp. L3T2-6 TaxID=3062491 RepID=UPI0026752FB8|nr:YaiO family outer membrane beta-barrel protein [Mucilaginibacter sp. L3T2-6]MDV6217830.1 YaiO family outer membrane beta-barrel protein [Mucilaginibacter sp. L3T2-6]